MSFLGHGFPSKYNYLEAAVPIMWKCQFCKILVFHVLKEAEILEIPSILFSKQLSCFVMQFMIGLAK